ncbi:MAG: BamA/OMP85 family outer membrane protein [Candidatus Latescibacterota bacterium]
MRVVGVPREAGDLYGALLSRPGGMLNEGLIAHDRTALADKLHERGWWNAAVEAEADSLAGKRILTFRVSPGWPVRFGKVRVESPENVSGLRKGAGDGLSGKPFARSALDSLALGILAALSDEGYPDAEVTPQLAAGGETVDVLLRVTPGAQARVDSIAVRGLTITKDRIIRRELSPLLGRPVTPGLLAEARTVLDRLGFVRVEADPAVEYSERGSLLAVRLSEGSRGAFDGALGYQPASDGGSGEMVGKVDLSVLNLFGTGRSARLRWENLGKDSEDMEFRWEEPWVFGLPFDVSGSFAQERRDAQGFTRTLLAADVGRNLGRLHARAGIRHERTSADSLTSSGATGVEAFASWSALDSPLNPRSGLKYSASWSALRKSYRFGNGGKTALTRAEFSFDHYLPSFSGQTAALLLSYRRVDTGKDVPDPADRFWLGGASSLRGYREKVFPADRALLASLEYRFLTGEASRVFLFTDIGHLWNRERSGDITVTRTLTRIGYGFGLRLHSRAGTLGFDYGLGKGDSPGQGKLHVRLSTEF